MSALAGQHWGHRDSSVTCQTMVSQWRTPCAFTSQWQKQNRACTDHHSQRSNHRQLMEMSIGGFSIMQVILKCLLVVCLSDEICINLIKDVSLFNTVIQYFTITLCILTNNTYANVLYLIVWLTRGALIWYRVCVWGGSEQLVHRKLMLNLLWLYLITLCNLRLGPWRVGNGEQLSISSGLKRKPRSIKKIMC